MAKAKKAAKDEAKGQVDTLKATVKLVQKEHTKIRKAVIDALADLARIQADMEKEAALAKEERAKVKRLFADPLYSVPGDLKRRVEEAEAKVKTLEMLLAEKVNVDHFDRLNEAIAELEKKVEEALHDSGANQTHGADLDTRVLALEGTVDALEDVMSGSNVSLGGAIKDGVAPPIDVDVAAQGPDLSTQEG